MTGKTYQHFKYNVNNYTTQTYQYGSDSSGNIISVINQSVFDLTDANGVVLGNVQFLDTGIAVKSTTDFYANPQLYNEVGGFFVNNVGSFTYNLSFEAGSSIFSSGLVVPTIVSATGVYYNKVDQISIKANSDGSRDVWISLKK
jgi:hypothetical protein